MNKLVMKDHLIQEGGNKNIKRVNRNNNFNGTRGIKIFTDNLNRC